MVVWALARPANAQRRQAEVNGFIAEVRADSGMLGEAEVPRSSPTTARPWGPPPHFVPETALQPIRLTQLPTELNLATGPRAAVDLEDGFEHAGIAGVMDAEAWQGPKATLALGAARDV